MKRARVFLVMLILLSLLPLAACTSEDVAFVSEMAEEWARAKGINPTSEDGGVDLGGIIGALTTVAS
jgi:ABC-type proline/glycine betaine transport system permease subunit